MAPLRAVEKPPCGILRTPRPGGGVQATAAAGMLLSRARQRRGRGWERATRPRRCLGVGPGATMGKIISVASKLRRDRARRLRRDQTETEARLWEVLRAGRLDGWKWRRQASVGPFIVDFLCLEAALVGKKLTSQPRRSSSRMYWLVSGFWTWKPPSAMNSSMPSVSVGSRLFACAPWPA